MKKIYKPVGKFSDLRRLADELLRKKGQKSKSFPGELGSMFHELQTHQIELELQNEELKQAQLALSKSQKKFSDLYDFAPVGYMTVNDKGLILESNLTLATMLGVDRGRLIEQPLSAFITKTDQDIYYFTRKKLLKSLQQQVCELRLHSKTGKVFFAQMRLTISQDVDGNSGQFRVVVTDINDSILAQEKINTLSQAIEQSPVSVIITDTDANIEYVNSNFEQTTGYTLEEVMGKNPCFLQSGKNSLTDNQNIWKTLNDGDVWQGEFLNQKKNGETFWEHAYIAPVISKSGKLTHYLAVKEDITFRKQQQEQILYQANYDKLTGLPNRFLALDRLSQLINEARRHHKLLALLFLDLDDFKKVNDTLGHETGDLLLNKAASRLSSVIRSGDTVARWGGDEFIIILGELETKDDVHSVLESILKQFRKAFKINDREFMTTTSIGVTFYPEDGDGPQLLLRLADSAMYHAKTHGANTFSFYSKDMNAEISKRLLIEEQMRGALERNEFEVYYQAKIDIKSQQVFGAEALLRWHNDSLGNISPEVFIPIAEQTGLIVSIGQFVLQQALTVLAKWQQEYAIDFQMAVNLSPKQFRDTELVKFVKQALNETAVTMNSLELEITEGVLMSDYKHVDESLSELSLLGVSIAMDDFGTGYSSLNYLRSHHFDVLKIDQSFISDINLDSADRELVSAAIAMGHSLGLKIVAEGVETQTQLTYLKKLDCDYAQGYLYNKPLPEQEMLDWMKSRNAKNE
ncbi:MAG: EAL domain-containing protein [Gammaproteobacteria bacterium]|nr:EAL domain-containing protein [Gammaproteobacteria bacterium]